MPLIKKDETFPARSVMVIIVGTPFSYKTSLALTAKKPLLFDFENGSERAHGRTETYRIDHTGWKGLEDDLAAGMLDPFDTVIADTGGALVDDHLWEHGLAIKFTKNDMQNWGTVKTLFKKFFSFIRGRGKDLVVISHEKSKDKNDETVYDLDISGGGKQLLIRSADQIGFIAKKDFKDKGVITTKTILTFWPTASLPFCKNVAGLEDIVLPDCKSKEWDGFLDRMVIEPTRKAIMEMSEDQKNALAYIEEWRNYIDSLIPVEGEHAAFDEKLKESNKQMALVEPEHIKLQIKAYFIGHLGKIAWKWVGADKVFKPLAEITTPAVVETKPADPAPAATPPAAEPPLDPMADAKAQREEIEAASNAQAAPAVTTTPQIIKNPHMGPPKADLFAKVPEVK